MNSNLQSEKHRYFLYFPVNYIFSLPESAINSARLVSKSDVIRESSSDVRKMSDSISASSVVEVSRSTVDNSPRDSDPNSVTDSLNNKEEGQGTDLVKEAPVSTVGTLSSETVPDSSTTGSETNSHPSLDPANLHYEGDICIYTDPATKYQYAWNSEKYEWIPKDAVFSNVTIPGPTTVNKQKRGTGKRLWIHFIVFSSLDQINQCLILQKHVQAECIIPCGQLPNQASR